MPKIRTVSEVHLARTGCFPEHEIPVILPFFDKSTRVAIAVALDSGLRSIKELLNRRWEDIDWVNFTMLVPGSAAKNDQARIVPIAPEPCEAFRVKTIARRAVPELPVGILLAGARRAG